MSKEDLSQYEATSWAENKDFREPFDFTTSSGQLARLRRLAMDDLIILSLENDLDFFVKAIMGNDDKKKKQDDAGVAGILANASGKDFAKLMAVVNAVVVSGVIAPKLHAIPEHENARQKGLLYVDSIPMPERMELFSVIFDSAGIEAFQDEETDGVGPVADEPDVPVPTE